MTTILGISAYYHDSAAALLVDGRLVAAAQEERFTRKKNDASFPVNAIKYVLEEAGLRGEEITRVAYYEKPFLKFERLLEVYHSFAPRGIKSYLKAIPVWMREKLYAKKNMAAELAKMGIKAPMSFPEHHLSHAASAFFPSPFDEAAVLTVDGVGEWATATICEGKGNGIKKLAELDFPHSLGLFYSAFTYYCGFKVNGGEYKLMGLSPYGDGSDMAAEYVRIIKENLIDIREDGSFLLNMEYFDFATGLTMTNTTKWEKLFGFGPRKPESEIGRFYIDLANAAQKVTEEVILKLARTAREMTGYRNLVMAGGVALNCAANGVLRKEGVFENIWVQPAAGDAGGAVGAAFALWHISLGKEREVSGRDKMGWAYLGPSYTGRDVENLILRRNASARYLPENEMNEVVSGLLAEGAVVGWFKGRMEFGPRALGNRSILANPCDEDTQRKLNMEIKRRESFRPFAPSVLEEESGEYFEWPGSSPYMLFVDHVVRERRKSLPEDYRDMSYMEKLRTSHSDLPAVTHVDFSARVQTVSREANPSFHGLLEAFKRKTGFGVLVNTSFNVRGEPIVCSPDNAFDCFMNTGMDYLVIENYLFSKTDTKNEH